MEVEMKAKDGGAEPEAHFSTDSDSSACFDSDRGEGQILTINGSF
jgi:hypothetical protein